MAITYRRARIDDLQEVAGIYRLSLSHVYERHGFAGELMLPRGINPFYAFMLREEPDGFFVAEDDGKPVGATHSWMRGSVWFLSHLFVLPEYQGNGIGNNLLEMTLKYGSHAGIYSVMTMGFNVTSVSLYMKKGMYPTQQVFLMRTSGLPECKETVNGSIHPEIAGQDAWRGSELNAIDEEVLGMSRMEHHRFFLEDQQAQCLLFRQEGRAYAYAYLWPDGRIGPAAARKDAPWQEIITFAILHAGKQCSGLSMMIPGSNRIALETAFFLGFTVRLPYLLLASESFGNWERYTFHSPGMM